MKKLVSLAIFFFILSCTQNDDRQLNDGIYDGRGGISCEVNGIVLKPSAALLYNNKDFTFGTNADNVPTLSIYFLNNTGNSPQSVRIVALEASYEDDLVGKVFTLQNETNQDSFGTYEIYNNGLENKFTTNDIKIGELKILAYNKHLHTMGGVFWFDAVNSSGEMVKVRNGKFDLKE